MSRENKPSGLSTQVESGAAAPQVGTVSFSQVQILESTERWSDMTLDDGTICRLKWSPIKVIRANGAWDNEGNPLYQVSSVPLLTITVAGAGLSKQQAQ